MRTALGQRWQPIGHTMKDSLSGSRILITGASSGIGAATARLLARRGAIVGLVARRAELLQEVLEECQAHSPKSRMWVADLGDLERTADLAEEVWESLGGIDVVINNAATPKVRVLDRLTPEDVEEAMRVNFLSPVRIIQTLLPRMLERRSGMIVNVSSLGGRLGIAHEAAYCASKFALTGFSETMSIDLDGSGVQVRLVIPGPFDTDIWDRPGSDPAANEDFEKFPPEVCAEGIADAILSDSFEHYVPDMKAFVEFKTSNIEKYLSGAASNLST